jgi:hypothetical protein
VRGYGLNLLYWGYGPKVGSCEYGNEKLISKRAGNVLTKWETLSFLRRTMLHGITWLLVFSILCSLKVLANLKKLARLIFGDSTVFQILKIKLLWEKITVWGERLFLATVGTCRAIVKAGNKGGRDRRGAQCSHLNYSGDQIDDCPKAGWNITSPTDGLAGALCFASPWRPLQRQC